MELPTALIGITTVPVDAVMELPDALTVTLTDVFNSIEAVIQRPLPVTVKV